MKGVHKEDDPFDDPLFRGDVSKTKSHPQKHKNWEYISAKEM